MEIRKYQIGEEETIWDIVFTATREVNAKDYHPELIDRWAPLNKDMAEWAERLSEQNPYVAVVDGQLVGMAELEDSGFIDYFYVHPKFHRQGVGKALLGIIEAEAQQIGIQRLFADVSITAKPFFLSQGFSITESRMNVILGHPAPNFAMEKIL